QHFGVKVEHVPVQSVESCGGGGGGAGNVLERQSLAVEPAEDAAAALGTEGKGQEGAGGGHGGGFRIATLGRKRRESIQFPECDHPNHLRSEGFMGRRFVQHLTDGESIEEVYLVTDKQLRANRNGNTYLQVELRDRTGAITARLWNVGEAQIRNFEIGDYLLVKGKVQLFQGALQVSLTGFDRN